ncbi:MAG: extracellular solute-binding protein [Rhodospirillaceae bacterium]|nr:extracellular solute-binding protein [Rhodospirillaceae bacterium]
MGKNLFAGMSRRDALKMMAAAGVGVTMTPLGAQKAKAEGEIIYHTWAGYDEPAMLTSYIQKYGGMPEVSYIANEEESMTKILAGYTPDVMHPGVYNVQRWHDQGMLQPIDISRITVWNDIFETVRNEQTIVVDGQTFNVPAEFGNSSVLYRTDLVDPEYLENPSWNLLYDDRYAGRLAFYNAADSIVQCAALALGMENIYDLSDEQLVEVKAMAIKQRDLLRFYWDDTTQFEQAMATGEIVAAYSWNVSLVNLKKEGVPVDLMVPKEGILTWVSGFVIHKDAKNIDACYDLINAWTAPESGAWIIDNFGYGSTNAKAYELLAEERLAELGFADPQKVLDGSLYFKGLDPAVSERYETLANEVQAGG